MPYEFPPQVGEIIKRQLEIGNFRSEDEVLLAALQSLEAVQEDWSAVRAALDSFEQGEKGLSLDEAFDTVRRKHDIPADA